MVCCGNGTYIDTRLYLFQGRFAKAENHVTANIIIILIT
jgi:hypothetical protein